MTAPLIISVSGLRGQVGRSLNQAVVERYISAFIEFLSEQGAPYVTSDSQGKPAFNGCVMVSYDGRESGLPIAIVTIQTFQKAGIPVVMLGVAATPTTGFLVADSHSCMAGVQITASHNPHPWNGIKLFNAEGRVIPACDGARVKAIYERKCAEDAEKPKPPRQTTLKPAENTTKTTYTDATFQQPHIDAILRTVDVEAIRARKFRVVLDSNHGSGSVMGRVLLEALGCEWRFAAENEEPNGDFQHTPEPTEENLQSVCAKVPEFQADVGFCQDPDADRLAVIAADGTYIGEEYTVALCAEAVMREYQPEEGAERKSIVTNCSTSLMTHDAAKRFGLPSFFSKVGEANVIDLMRAKNALFGGEGNGGPIDPRIGCVRDSFVGMAQILHLMAKTGQSVLELTGLFPRYAIVKRKYTFPLEKLPARYEEIQKATPDAEIDLQDGVRLAWPGRWVLVRPSNTEPIIRIIAEAETTEAAEGLIASLETLLN